MIKTPLNRDYPISIRNEEKLPEFFRIYDNRDYENIFLRTKNNKYKYMNRPPKLKELIIKEKEKNHISKKNNNDFNALIIPTQLIESGIKQNILNVKYNEKASDLTILIIETFSISSPNKIADPDFDPINVLFFTIINEKNRSQQNNQLKNSIAFIKAF